MKYNQIYSNPQINSNQKITSLEFLSIVNSTSILLVDDNDITDISHYIVYDTIPIPESTSSNEMSRI